MKSNTPLKPVSSKIVYQNPWIRVREDYTIDMEGQKGIYGIMESRDSVMIVTINPLKEIFLNNNFSYPAQAWSWELPGGGDDNEDAITASKRELFEETGIIAKKCEAIGKTRVCNGLMTEKTITIIATDLSYNERPKADDSNLIADGRFFTLDQIYNMTKNGQINDNQSITSLFLAEQWLKDN